MQIRALRRLLSKVDIADLCALIEEFGLALGMCSWPPILRFRNALTVALTYLHRNPGSGGNRRGLRRLPAHDKPRHLRDHPAARRSPGRFRLHRRRSRPRLVVHRGRHAVPVLDMAGTPGTGVRQASGIRTEGSPMGETRRKFDLDFREGAVRLVRETVSRSRRRPVNWGSTRTR
jgi:hypothetical protein